MDPSAAATMPAAAPPAASAGSSAKEKKKKLQQIWAERPARRQIRPDQVNKTVKESNFMENFNIWYQKSSNFEQSQKEPRRTRCDVEKDSGFTKANSSGETKICHMFAQGCCPHGADCRFLHRIPLDTDREEPAVDCFGRDRFGSDRQDMGGIGTWSRENTTLYIGGVVASDSSTEKMIYERFAPFGDITSVKILKTKPVAFVRFKRRSNAEFAREATWNMVWETGEMYNVRWATEDPNPKAKAEFLDDARDRLFEAVKGKTTPEMMEQYVMVAQTEMAAEDQVGVGKNVRVTDFYPSTDSQYNLTPQDLENMKYGYTKEAYTAVGGNQAAAYQNYDPSQAATDPNYQQYYQQYYQGYDPQYYQQYYQQYYSAYQQQQQQPQETSTGAGETTQENGAGEGHGKRKREGEDDIPPSSEKQPKTDASEEKKTGKEAVSLVSYASDEE